MSRSLAILVVLGASACVDPVVDLGSDDHPYEIAADVPAQLRRGLDLLFVVDNSEGMTAGQNGLVASFGRLLPFFDYVEGGAPDLHIGVVSTDMGVGPYAVPGCSAAGDGGALQAGPRSPACGAPADPFLSDLAQPDGSRWRNFEGDLGDAFSCIAALGDSGCGFEQPLAALQRVMSRANPDDDGFLRPDAVLAVVVLTNDDDCTARDPSLFDLADESLGPEKFRCFEYGVQCEGDDVAERGRPGRREGCKAREDSPLVDGVEPYINAVYERRDPEQVVVAGLFGDPSLVEVSIDVDGQPQLVPSCSGDETGVYPAVRLQGFLDGFPRHSDFESICAATQGPHGALAATAREIRKALGTPCLEGDLADGDPTRAGLQPQCRTTQRLTDGEQRPIPPCAESDYPLSDDELPCFTLTGGAAACGDFPTQLAVSVFDDPDGPPAAPVARTIVECIME